LEKNLFSIRKERSGVTGHEHHPIRGAGLRGAFDTFYLPGPRTAPAAGKGIPRLGHGDRRRYSGGGRRLSGGLAHRTGRSLQGHRGAGPRLEPKPRPNGQSGPDVRRVGINRFFGKVFGPAIVFWMEKVLYGKELEETSPAALARNLDVPALLIHGELDPTFPVSYAEKLARSFPEGRARLWVAKGAGHSDASARAGYEETVRGFLAAHGTAKPIP
jgi:pimeloyl-ACP methyl ester carboxylesterase